MLPQPFYLLCFNCVFTQQKLDIIMLASHRGKQVGRPLHRQRFSAVAAELTLKVTEGRRHCGSRISSDLAICRNRLSILHQFCVNNSPVSPD